jgi:hypothetical protein
LVLDQDKIGHAEIAPQYRLGKFNFVSHTTKNSSKLVTPLQPNVNRTGSNWSIERKVREADASKAVQNSHRIIHSSAKQNATARAQQESSLTQIKNSKSAPKNRRDNEFDEEGMLDPSPPKSYYNLLHDPLSGRRNNECIDNQINTQLNKYLQQAHTHVNSGIK